MSRMSIISHKITQIIEIPIFTNTEISVELHIERINKRSYCIVQGTVFDILR